MGYLPDRTTNSVKAGTAIIGGGSPIAVQSMAATRTTDIDRTVWQISLLEQAGADLIRVAIDSKKDVEALRSIRAQTAANLVIDLQENYRLAAAVAPFVQKLRYNPGHLHHHQREVPVEDKVRFLVDTAGSHGCALRIGVNFGSLDPAMKASLGDPELAAVESALRHVDLVESFGFSQYVVSLKSSDPEAVVRVNRVFRERCPRVPIHLGVTEAGLPPDGVIKTRVAFEQLLPLGIGDTVRVSLTVPDEEKGLEVQSAREIIRDIDEGRFRSVPELLSRGLNVISCPSCSRVENSAIVKLAQEVKRVTDYAREHRLTIAVMGCRVNGPGETDHADLGLWCAPNFVNLKRGSIELGHFRYDEVIARLLEEVDRLIAERQKAQPGQEAD